MNNSIKQLMLDLIKQGIRFNLNGDKVKLEGDLSNLSNEIKTQLRQHKDEIVALVKAGQQAKIGSQSSFQLTKAPNNEPVPLSYAQQRLWFIDQLEQGSPEYNMPLALNLTGPLEIKHLITAVEALQQRHELLSSRFIAGDDGVWLSYDANIQAAISQTDLSAVSDNQQRLNQLALEDAQTPFNLAEPPFFRVHIVKLAPEHHGLLLNFHHIITDGWSEQIILDELLSLYHSINGNDIAPLPELNWQYRDYAWSQRQWLKGDKLSLELDYWRQRLNGLPQVHALNLDSPERTRPAQQTFNGKSLSTSLDANNSHALHQLCLAEDVTLFMLLETAFAILLARLSGENDIAIGTPVSGRIANQIEPLVGCFLNTLVLRNQLDLNHSFLAALKHNKQQILADFEHQTLPFELLVESINPERSLSHGPLFQIFFTLNQFDGKQNSNQTKLQITPISQPVTSTKFDLSLVAGFEPGQPLTLSWTFNSDLFTTETISLFAQRFEVLLHEIIANPNQSLATINYLTPSEQAKLANFNQGPALAKPTFATINQWFEQQVKQTPNAIAVSTAQSAPITSLSYEQLNQRANVIAHALQAQGISQGDLVGVLLARNCDLLATLIAIFKTGAGYVPIDSQYPQQRRDLIIDDSKIKLLVSTQNLTSDNHRNDINYLWLDNLESLPTGDITAKPDLNADNSADNSAYVIYTSGSTGKPKGVAISHGNALALLTWALDYFTAESLAKVAATTSVCFDLSVFELFAPLVSGNQVVLFENGLSVNQAADITLINTVPSVMQALVAEHKLPATLTTINLAGEALKRRLVDDIFALKPEIQLFNLYGPSEDTTYSTVAKMSAGQLDIPDIGQPIAGTKAQVLDSNGLAVGIGITGELYLSGAGVATGYLHQAQLSAEKFTANGYRTGDLVRWRHDGKLDYIGRADRQVKLRGFRIEPGEIEAIICHQADVASAAVKVVNDRLIAWIETQNNDLATLTATISDLLPNHMQPSDWVLLAKLPTTSNGKIDYRALPEPEQQQNAQIIAPVTKTEQILFTIWQGLLGHDNFGIEDNFFTVGGDSILSIQVVSRAKSQGLHFSVRQLFEAQTIKALGKLCDNNPTNQAVEIPQQALSGEFDLLPIQRDFFAQQLNQPHHYNQAVILNVPPAITEHQLKQMLRAIVARHDALRLRFKQHGENQFKGKFQPLAEFELEFELELISDAQACDISARCAIHQASLNYQTGPLFKAVYFANSGHLLLIAHHLIIDGVSWRIILNDLEILAQQQPLGAKTHGINHWQKALGQYLVKAAEQQAFWLAQWQQNQTVIADHKQPQQLQNHSLELSKSLTTKLLRDSHQAYNTEVPEILLASLLKAWQQLTNNQNLVIALEGHGREPELLSAATGAAQSLDLTETVGWFTTLYPLALTVKTSANQAQRIKQVKETLRQVPDKGLGYGVLRYLKQDQELIAAQNYQDTVVFNYLGQFDAGRSDSSESSNQAPTSFTTANINMGPFSSEQNRLRHLLGLNGMISNGQLQFSLSYDALRICADKIAHFAELWLQALEEDINFASSSDNRQLTPSDFPLATVDIETLDSWQLAYPNIENLYQATPMQQGLMFHGLYDGDLQDTDLAGVTAQQSYITQTYFDLHGPLNSQAFTQAWQIILNRHDIFRTAFVGQTQGKIQQLVVKPFEYKVNIIDWRNKPATGIETALIQLRTDDKAQGFDFAQPPLMRTTLVQLNDQHWHVVWSHHHVLLDGWCLPLVFNQIMSCYHMLTKGIDPEPQLPMPTPYVNYIQWLNAQNPADARAYWHAELAGFYQNQPVDKTFAALGQFQQGEINLTEQQADYHQQQLTLSDQISAQLQQVIKRSNSTLNLILQAAWSSLVARFNSDALNNGEQNILFGTTVAGRPAELIGVENMVGLFINTLPVAIRFNPEQTLSAFLTTLGRQNIDRQANGYLSLSDIAACSSTESNMSAAQLFDTLVVVENFPVAAEKTDKKTSHNTITIGNMGADEHTRYPLTLICHQRHTTTISFGYQPDKFDDASINRLMQLLQQTLALITVEALSQPLSALKPLTALDQTLLETWATPRQQFNPNHCIHHRFEQYVAQGPNNIALTFEQHQLSYRKLNNSANQLAHYLIEQGVGPETIVGLHFEPSLNLMVAMLAILKAGGAYLPLVPELPKDRINHMLNDCQVTLVLTQTSLSDNISHTLNEKSNINTFCLDLPTSQKLLANQSQANPQLEGLKPHHLAYIIYTSGSTGLPKGVRIEHRNVVRLLSACEIDFGAAERQVGRPAFNKNDVWTLFHGYGFDFSVWEIWGALAYGGRLVIVPKALKREPQAFAQLLTTQQVTVLNQTPSAFYPLIEYLPAAHNLRFVVFGGEALNYSLLQPWFATQGNNNCQLVNMYGITETCVHATFKTISADDCRTGKPSTIGRALADLSFRVCDQNGALQIPGAPGELWIAGGGVARDYLNRPQLTGEKFVEPKHQNRHQNGHQRYYRSGDSVRWRANGELDYLGRIDQQVKIRGFRIELGEIEAKLSLLEHIDNVAVLARKDDDQAIKLVAYLAVNSNNQQTLDNGQIKQQLARQLPQYMVPEHYVLLEKLPLTVNGKIDRKALPKPTESDLDKAEHISAQTPLQQQLVELWQQILGLQQIGINDNFFSLGGDSIVAIQVVARARQLGLQISVRQVFEQPTIAQLAEKVAKTQMTASQQLESPKAQGALPLLPIHHHFFAQQLADPQHFNQSLLLNTPDQLAKAQLEKIIEQLVERHDSLRLVFNQDQGFYLDTPLAYLIVEPHYSEEFCNQIQSSFSIDKGPLAKFVWFEQSHKLLICLHHLIVDGVSWRILLSDLNLAFAGDTLAPRPMSLQRWSQALKHYANSERLNQQRDFWQAQTLNDSAPTWATEKTATRGQLRALSIQLSSAQTKQLLGPSHRPYNTRINDLLLAALVYSNRNNKQQSLLVELESHGREQLFSATGNDIDISETVGWFTAVYPILLESPRDNSWADTIIAVKEKLRKVPDGGIGYGVLRYLADTPLKEVENNKPQDKGLLFNYLGQFDSSYNNHSAFYVADEPMGSVSSKRNLPSHPLTLNGMVEGGKLGFNLNYDSGLVSQNAARQLLDNYRQALIDCIDHCQNASGQLSPADFADADVSQTQLKQWQQHYPQMSGLYLATPMQTGLLFHGMLDSQDAKQLTGSDYSTQTILTLTGQVNVEHLRGAWQQLVNRHDILRTCFVGIGEGAIHQLVQTNVTLPFESLDWSNHSDFQTKRQQLLEADKQQGFDFAQAPLLRITLVKESASLYHLIWTHHHSLLDGWCLPILFKQLEQFYQGLLQQQPVQLDDIPPYQNYIAWLNKQDKSQAKNFWQQQLAGFDSPVEISIKKPLATGQLGPYQHQSLQLSADLSAKLNRLARALQTTQSTIVQGAWALLLARYGRTDDVVFGVTVSGRPAELEGIEQMVGLFINTIPVRVKFSVQQSLADVLTPLQQDNLTRENYSFLSLADIQQQSDVNAGTSLFDSLVIFENYPIEQALADNHGDDSNDQHQNFVISAAHSEEQTNYALTLLAHQTGESLLFNLGYHQGQFEQHSIKRLLGHFEHILKQLSTNITIGDISLINEAERQQLNHWAKPPITCGPFISLTERFAQQVAKTPEALAVSCQGQQLTYRQLNAQANALSKTLSKQLKNNQHKTGQQQSDVVGIYLERDITMIVAMLAVLKAGYAYLPLDKGYPKARLLEMAEDSQIHCVIANQPLSDNIHTIKPQAFSNDTASEPTITNNAPAYRIYTSGSTGKPKGVTISHGNVAALIDWALQFYRQEQLAVVAAVTPISFDISVFEIFVPLCAGGTVALMENALNIDDHNITLLNTVPSVLKAALNEQPLPANLKAINLAGEPLPQDLLDTISSANHELPVYNLYGPSEDTVFSTGCQVFAGQTPPIGHPVAGSEAYVLDQTNNQVPIGVPGELYLSGAGVGLGYHNRPQLNQAVFIQHPLNQAERCYKTGDLVRWREDGKLEYLGRIDNQIKLRGLRIELGEVEARLNQLGIENSVQVYHHQLVAFITSQGDINAIKQKLHSTLPTHMVPDRFITIEQLPLSNNGKIDRQQLFKHLECRAASAHNKAGQTAQTATEIILTTTWQGLLKTEHINRDDDFFALGGDSIIAIQVVTRARRQGLSLTVRAIFEHSSVASLAAFIDQNSASAKNNAEQGPLTGKVELLPIQHDFFAQQLARPNHYNQAMLLTTPAQLTVEQCHSIIRILVNKHDALRLQFDLEPVASFQGHDANTLDSRIFATIELDSLERQQLTELCHQYQASLDINTGPLLKAVYFKPQGTQGRLLLAIHHLVVDGVSWRILLDDLRNCWQAITQGLKPQLGIKTDSIRAWQQALSQLDLSDQLDYWQAQLAAEPLAYCQSCGENHSANLPASHVEGLSLSLDQTSTAALIGESLIPYNTSIEELLLAALLKAAISWSGQSQLTIELESHGRETQIVNHSLDLSETVGWFTALYPLKLSCQNLNWETVINAVKSSYRAIPNKGIGFGILQYLQNQPLSQRHRGILFNYLGQLDSLAGGENGSNNDFAIAPEPAGMPVSDKNRPANPLTINAHISAGCLQIAIHGDSSVLPPQQTARFADCYRQALYDCIEHCRHAKTTLTLADFSNARVDEASLQQWLQDYPTLCKLYPATPMQQGILFHCLLDENRDNDIYTTQTYADLSGRLDVAAFKQAWQALLNRHDVLRTSFVGLAMETIHQLVQSDVELPFTYIDNSDQTIDLAQWRAEDKAKGFNISDQAIEGPLMRVAVIRLSAERWHFVWTYHHVLLDGWSLPQLFNQVMMSYQAKAIAAPAANYEDYIHWLSLRDEHHSYQFWGEQLQGFESSDPFAALKQGPMAGEYILYQHQLSTTITAQLKQLAQQNRCTMNVLLQAAWAYLVHRYSGFDDIVFGATVSGRPSDLDHVEDIVGLFINSIPIRLKFDHKTTIKQLLDDLQHNNVRREEHSFVSLAQIQKQSNLTPGSALFESLLAFENYPLSENNDDSSGENDIVFDYIGSDEQTSFPLSLMAYIANYRHGDQLTLKFGFYQQQFNPTAMERLFNHLQQLLITLGQNGAEQPLNKWQLLPDDEYQSMVYEQNSHQAHYPVAQTIAALFEQVVAQHPQQIAITTGPISLDYHSVNQQANRLAAALLNAGLNTGEFVGIHLGRQVEFIIAAIAVFKAGGAYVPLDPNYPAQRISYIIDDAGMNIIISDANIESQFDWGSRTVIDVNQLDSHLASTNPNIPDLNGNDLAYMIYTSGTTGKPKGVMIEHGGFINSVYEQLRIMSFDQHSRVLAYASWNFDASVIEIFDALLAGGTLVLADEQQVKSPQLLTELMISEQVSHATIPPAIMPFLDPAQLPNLKHLMAAGEHCPMTEVKRWSESANRVFYNGFGPTEASVCFSVTPYSGGEFTMGRAINNKQAYIVDEQLRPVPQGVPGELLIGGSGIARGYHNLPQLSAEKFIPDPFLNNGGLIYRSGDRVKQLENGELMFLGRIDNQVKVRGHRIETGEIEARLQTLPQVKTAAVTVKQTQGGKQLLAAIVPQQPQPLELWPSVAEFYIYDDLLYRAMATDTRRISAFEGAINAAVKDQVILEIGPGNELLLTLMCLKAGARKIYAVELMEQTYQSAKHKLAQLREQDPAIQDKIVLIHGDATKVQLPEKADYCVSGIVGSIGGSEGAAKIINEVRHQLHNPANMLPKRTVTNLAAITLDDQTLMMADQQSYGFSPIAAHYTEAVFNSLGKSFDLRICLKNFKQKQMLSTIDVMENLDHSDVVALEDSHPMRLEITQPGLLHGFVAWLNLYTDDNHIMDILEADQSLLPIYLPVSLEGIAVQSGDVITGTMIRTQHSNGLNPNYRFDAQLQKADGQLVDVGFVTLHETDNFCASPFYQCLFTSNNQATAKPNLLPEQDKIDVIAAAKNQLAEQLPSYMVPSLFAELDALPLTVNGKIDYKAIAALEVSAAQSADYQAPSNEVEQQLCEIWQAALNNDKVSVNDNFFAAGGDSIIAIGVVAKARNGGLHLSVADIFEYSTIARLAPIVAANQAASLAPQQSSTGEVALWPIAEHFFEQQLPDNHHFNQSVIVNTPAGFGPDELKQILTALIERHDSLRLVIKDGKGKFKPLNEQFIKQCIVVEKLSIEPQRTSEREQITQRCNHWQSQFDLHQGPLLRALLLQNDQQQTGKLCLILHHLIVDGVSWRIILSDLKLAWQQLQQQQNITLGAKTHSLQQWRLSLDKSAAQIDATERQYWLEQLQKPVPSRISMQKPATGGQMQSCELIIDPEATRQLTGPCNDAYLTRINELLLAALHSAWRQWCGETVLPLAMESHGRNGSEQHTDSQQIDSQAIDLSETVGWFTALYPQRLEVALGQDLATTIDQIKTQYRQLRNNGIGFGLLKYIAKDQQIQQLAQPLDCEVVFNYLGQMDQALTEHGPFADARLATGYNASPKQSMAQLLAINGMVSEGQLSFSLSFDNSRLHLCDVEKLRDSFKQALLDVIDHCHNKIHNNQLFDQNSDLIVTDPNSMLDEGIEI